MSKEDDERFFNGITVEHHAGAIFNMLANYGDKHKVHPFVLLSSVNAALSKISYEFIAKSEVVNDKPWS